MNLTEFLENSKDALRSDLEILKKMEKDGFKTYFDEILSYAVGEFSVKNEEIDHTIIDYYGITESEFEAAFRLSGKLIELLKDNSFLIEDTVEEMIKVGIIEKDRKESTLNFLTRSEEAYNRVINPIEKYLQLASDIGLKMKSIEFSPINVPVMAEKNKEEAKGNIKPHVEKLFKYIIMKITYTEDLKGNRNRPHHYVLTCSQLKEIEDSIKEIREILEIMPRQYADNPGEAHA